MNDEFTLTLNSPITEDQWDMITDVDFDNTNEIIFHTKHGKEVKFVKASAQPERKTGRWLIKKIGADAQCSECGTYFSDAYDTDNSDAFCRHCGAKMDGWNFLFL